MKRVVALALLTSLLWLGWALLPRNEVPRAPPRPTDGQWQDSACWFNERPSRHAGCAWLYPSIQGVGDDAALPVVRLQRSFWRASRRATVYLMGGPGGDSYLYRGGIGFWRDWMDRVGLDHDLVLYDQRGSGYAEPALECEPLDGIARSLLDAGLDIEAQWTRVEAVLTRCAAQVPAADRAAGLYSTATAAQDLRELIQTLRTRWGYEEIAVFGVSYGSRLAVEALAEPIEGVSRVLLDSYYPVGVDLNLAFPDSFAALLAHFEANCRAADDCTIPAEGLRGLLARALAVANRSPRRIETWDFLIESDQAVLIDAPTLISLVEHALYADLDSGALPLRMREFIDGNLGEDWQLLVSDWLYANFDPGFSLLSYLLIECRDNAPTTPEQGLAVLARHPDWQAALRQAPDSFRLCERFGVSPRPLTPRTPAVPTLLLAAQFDPRTPAAIALRAARDFPDLQTLVLPIAGHSVVDFDDCAAAVAGRFLNSGRVSGAENCRSGPGTVHSHAAGPQ